ncbi:MAG: hypothetical protein II280_05700 [Lachnospiraceae bacterium]|nr:hypothetical protein [Lachnospiraceae bacterium]
MKSGSTKPNSKKKQLVLEELWLNYLNAALFSKGAISENDYRSMQRRIIARTASMTR